MVSAASAMVAADDDDDVGDCGAAGRCWYENADDCSFFLILFDYSIAELICRPLVATFLVLSLIFYLAIFRFYSLYFLLSHIDVTLPYILSIRNTSPLSHSLIHFHLFLASLRCRASNFISCPPSFSFSPPTFHK